MGVRTQLSSDRLLKMVWPLASFTSWDLTSHVSVQHKFFSCKFPCQNYKQIFDQRSSLLCVPVWYRNFYFIFDCHGQLGELQPDGKLLMHFMSSLVEFFFYYYYFFLSPPFVSYGCFNLNMFSFFNGIVKLALKVQQCDTGNCLLINWSSIYE